MSCPLVMLLWTFIQLASSAAFGIYQPHLWLLVAYMAMYQQAISLSSIVCICSESPNSWKREPANLDLNLWIWFTTYCVVVNSWLTYAPLIIGLSSGQDQTARLDAGIPAIIRSSSSSCSSPAWNAWISFGACPNNRSVAFRIKEINVDETISNVFFPSVSCWTNDFHSISSTKILILKIWWEPEATSQG